MHIPIDGDLADRVRARVGAEESAFVEIREEEWDLGYCDTCSYPEEGFSVYVDGKQVWPDEEYLSVFGGVAFADADGIVEEDCGNRSLNFFDNLSIFNEWLKGTDLEEVQEVLENSWRD